MSSKILFHTHRDNKRVTRNQMKRMAEQSLTKTEKEATKTSNKSKKFFKF